MHVNWTQKHQVITGFGVYAGRMNWLQSSFPIDDFFGNDGLRLNIVRGAVYSSLFEFPRYQNFQSSDGDLENWDPDRVVTKYDPLPKDDPILNEYMKQQEYQVMLSKMNKRDGKPNFNMTGENSVFDKEMRLLETISQKYDVKVILSGWTPPVRWKRFPDYRGYIGRLPFNYLLREHYDDYARYIVEFIKFYKAHGLNVYGVSPQNEPEYPAKWDGCFWWPWTLGEFTKKHMKPTLRAADLDVKLIGPESANPIYSRIYSALNPHYKDKTSPIDIEAVHGYEMRRNFTIKIENLYHNYNNILKCRYSTQYPYPTYNMNPIRFGASAKERWVTEGSSVFPFKSDETMTRALELAESLHKFLTVSNVNAYVYWLGINYATTNEALIYEEGGIKHSPAYYAYGQFTRFIRPGYQRIDLKFKAPICSKLMASFYTKKEVTSTGVYYHFTLVMVNRKNYTINAVLDLNAENVEFVKNSLQQVETTVGSKWSVLSPPTLRKNDTLVTPVLADSIRTVIGLFMIKPNCDSPIA